MQKKIGLCLLLFALQASATTALQQLHRLLDPVHTLKADFTQTTLSPEGLVVSTAKGQLQIKRPGKFYWRTTQPGKQTIVINDKQLWLFDEDLQQVTKKKLSKDTMVLSPASLLSGDLQLLSKNYRISLGVNGSESVIRVATQSNQSAVQWVELSYEKRILKGLRFKNKLQQVTTIRFNHVQLNGRLKNSIFQFSLPPGVDLLGD